MPSIQHIQLAAVKSGSLEWSAHAIKRMTERGITKKAVKSLITQGRILKSYPEDTPFPSVLLHGSVDTQLLHVVVAYDAARKEALIITAYFPDTKHFELDGVTRKRL